MWNPLYVPHHLGMALWLQKAGFQVVDLNWFHRFQDPPASSVQAKKHQNTEVQLKTPATEQGRLPQKPPGVHAQRTLKALQGGKSHPCLEMATQP